MLSALLGGSGLLLTGCSAAVRVEDPTLVPPLDAMCERLVERLPDRLAGEDRRRVLPRDAPAAAWGDPPVVLRCGVAEPRELEPTSVCEEVDGVGWFLPETQQEDPGSDLEYTTLGFEPRVSVRVPAAYRSEVTSVIVPLAEPIKQTLELVEPCV